MYRPLKGAARLNLLPVQEDIFIVTLIYTILCLLSIMLINRIVLQLDESAVDCSTPLIKCKCVTFPGTAFLEDGVEYSTRSTTHTHTHTHTQRKPQEQPIQCGQGPRLSVGLLTGEHV